jgi:para-nitrobenzyl esterase
VRDHIADFGGDPEQVTIFGESAGGVAVCTLLAMPDAEGLFVRAIAQSGTANRLGDQAFANGMAQRLVQQLGLAADGGSPSQLAQLRGLGIQQLLAAQQAINPLGMLAPVADGKSLPQRPISAVREGVARRIPCIIGTNRDEAKLYIDPRRAQLGDDQLLERVRKALPARGREKVPAVIETYRKSRRERGLPHSNNDILDAIDTASRFGIPASRLAEAQSAHNPDTYAYLFDWESPAQRGTLGACHALELPFVFGTTNIRSMKRWVGAGPEADKLSGQMIDAWLAFAKTGNPSCAAVGDWPRYEPEQRQTMIFGKHTRPEAAPFEEERALWDSLL